MVAERIVIVMAVLLMSMMAMVGVFAARFKKVPTGHAMVIYGRMMSPQSSVGYRVKTNIDRSDCG